MKEKNVANQSKTILTVANAFLHIILSKSPI